MFSTQKLTLIVFFLLILGESLPAEGKDPILLPGRLAAAPSLLLKNNFLVPCEDRILYVFDQNQKIIGQYDAQDRFAFSPAVNGSLVALSLISGQTVLLRWEESAQQFLVVHRTGHSTLPSAPPAWDDRGNLHLAWLDGSLECWNTQGALVWQAREPGPVTAQLCDSSWGLVTGSADGVKVWNPRGSSFRLMNLPGAPNGLAESPGGLLCFYGDGWISLRSGEASKTLTGLPPVRNLLIGPRDRLIGILNQEVRIYKPDLSESQRFPLPRKVRASALFDSRGRILIPTLAGLEHWTLGGRLVEILPGPLAPAAPLLNPQGVLCYCGDDWKLRFASGYSLAPFGWPQAGAEPGRSFRIKRPQSAAELQAQWETSPAYQVFDQRIQEGNADDQRQILAQIEEKLRQGTLEKDWPFAHVLLLKIARSGIVDLRMDQGRVTNDWPGNRDWAYRLLVQTAGIEDRQELMTLLDRETETTAQIHGIDALAQTGYDGDGELAKLLRILQKRRPGDAQLGEALLKACTRIYEVNGSSADPSLVEVLTDLFSNSYPRSVRQGAQAFFQKILETS